jgi:hypothetical protein
MTVQGDGNRLGVYATLAGSFFCAGDVMTLAYWFTKQESGGFPVERAALGSCDLSVLHVGGEWQWLVRQAGRDVAEGAARAAVDAQRQAEAVALQIG